jgi:hypothetical protein
MFQIDWAGLDGWAAREEDAGTGALVAPDSEVFLFA